MQICTSHRKSQETQRTSESITVTSPGLCQGVLDLVLAWNGKSVFLIHSIKKEIYFAMTTFERLLAPSKNQISCRHQKIIQTREFALCYDQFWKAISWRTMNLSETVWRNVHCLEGPNHLDGISLAPVITVMTKVGPMDHWPLAITATASWRT